MTPNLCNLYARSIAPEGIVDPLDYILYWNAEVERLCDPDQWEKYKLPLPPERGIIHDLTGYDS